MAFIYVYSPYSGANWGQANYCYISGSHPAGFLANPIDIGGGAAGAAVRFYSSVGSIRTTRNTGLCSVNPGSPWNDGVMVELYRNANASCFIGRVYYGHLSNRIANGTYNSPNTLQIGTLASDTCSCGCYSGVHTHMTGTGTPNSFTCGQQLYGGSTWIYRWSNVCIPQ